MWSIKDIKSKAKTAFKGNYWRCVIAGIILMFLTAGVSFSSSTTGDGDLQAKINALSSGDLQAVFVASAVAAVIIVCISVLLKIFVFNPLEVGCYSFYKKNNIDNSTTLGESLKDGFGNYVHNFVTLFLADLFNALWLMLFIIPGCIKYYSYFMVPYIVKDNPELSATEAITRSREMMNGNKWRAFVMDLSFIGWHILGILTCGLVEVFWTAPYYYSTKAALYLELKNK